MGLSDYSEAALLNKLLRNTDFTSPAAVYVSLHNGAPGEDGANEITGGSYARQAVTFGAPSGGVVSNTGLLQWTDMPAVDLEGVGLWDALTNGNCLFTGAITGAPVTVPAGSTFEMAIGDLDASLD